MGKKKDEKDPESTADAAAAAAEAAAGGGEGQPPPPPAEVPARAPTPEEIAAYLKANGLEPVAAPPAVKAEPTPGPDLYEVQEEASFWHKSMNTTLKRGTVINPHHHAPGAIDAMKRQGVKLKKLDKPAPEATE